MAYSYDHRSPSMKTASKKFWEPVMDEDPKKVGTTWVRPGNKRDGEAHAFEEATFEDGSTVVNNQSLCGKMFKGLEVSKARAHGNISSEKCPKCKAKAGKTAEDLSMKTAGEMHGWTWTRRYQHMFDEYTQEVVEHVAGDLAAEGVVVTKKGINYVNGKAADGSVVGVYISPNGWGQVKISVSKGNHRKEWKYSLATGDAMMLAGEAVYHSGLF